MKRFLLSGIAAILIGFCAFNAHAQQTGDVKKKSFVLLELFTSEGCPTCPPADANLAFFEKEQPFADTEIVSLALHVDYWNSTKWRDIYSSPIFSRRQQLYSQAMKTGQNYTPQMIVDGQTEFSGNSLSKAQKAILDAAKTPKAIIEITPTTADKIKIKILSAPTHQTATIFLAITEDDLVSDSKTSGNSTRNPAHVSVVRELKSLGMISAEQLKLDIEAGLQIQPNWKRENLKLVVFVQENASRKVLGVNRKSLL